MKIIAKGFTQMSYPVGEQIQQNIPIIKEMGGTIMKEFGDVPINLICMGSSGAIIASIIAMQFKDIRICHIKKDGESSHSAVPNIKRGRLNIVVDDFIATGETMKRIFTKFDEYSKTRGNDLKIDCIYVTGGSKFETLPYKPKVFICSYELE